MFSSIVFFNFAFFNNLSALFKTLNLVLSFMDRAFLIRNSAPSVKEKLTLALGFGLAYNEISFVNDLAEEE